MRKKTHTIKQTPRITPFVPASQAQFQFNTSPSPFVVSTPIVFSSRLHHGLQYLRVACCSGVSQSSCSPSDLLQHELSPSKSVSPAASPAMSSSVCLLHFILWFLQNVALHVSSCIFLFVSCASSHLSFHVSYSPQLLPFLNDV